jgi:hypothetical protein
MDMSGQLHAPAALPQGKGSGTHWIGGWVGPRADLDAVVKRKIPSPCQPVAKDYTTELSQLLRLFLKKF